MSRWLERAASMQADEETHADSAISANSALGSVQPGPNGTNDTIGTAPLPPDVVAGIGLLRTMAAPRISRPKVWSAIVADAVRLASDGWASQALALGWSPLDLWGCSPDIGDNPDHNGLAVWLDGRRILLLDERTCIVDAGAGARAVFNRRASIAGAVLLWDISNRKAER